MEWGSKVIKVCKQVRDQRNGVQVLTKNKNKINSKAFAIPILTAITSADRNLIQSKQG